MKDLLAALAASLEGEFYFDDTIRTLYATDASAYRELPLAVAIPKSKEDISLLISFANQNNTSLIPRTAGTSLAGQVVGDGIVVDVSKFFDKILEINKEESWVRVQPGVIRDELNRSLKDHGLFFGPETSTANRAMIGGMVGNNSCGSNSVVYGSTRDHLLEVSGFLSDGSFTTFGSLTEEEFFEKCNGQHTSGKLETSIYASIQEMLADEANQEEIAREFPKPNIPRRNTGYAIDILANSQPFKSEGSHFNFCNLIAGSEGTLAFITDIKLHVDNLPPKHRALVCIHCNSIDESLRANLIGLKHNPSASELIDNFILECTANNIAQRQNRFFIEGDPEAILVVELSRDEEEQLDRSIEALISDLKTEGMGYAYPVLKGGDVGKIWSLRKAGLGLLSNIPGDAKPAPVIEDTAVDVEDLPAYIAEFNEILKKYDLHCVHYAHAGSGELHLRPILNLKTEEGNRLFKTIADEIAKLVKKYKGSLSGEHGDGRLRGEYVRFMVGEHNYELIKSVKETWDPKRIFNPGKIVDTPAMNESLRYVPGQETPEFDTYFDFSKDQGYIRAAEYCNGSGDCRKSELTGGTMCPSYMATHNEKDTTRARANILREVLTNSEKPNKFDSEEIKDVLDLCLSCKGCKSECPSNVDMARLKAEFTQQYYDIHGVPFRSKMIGNFNKMSQLASIAPGIYNFIFSNSVTSSLAKRVMGFAQKRPIPLMHKTTLKKWFQRSFTPSGGQKIGRIHVFCDEFTNFNDVNIGQKAILLLDKLGYEIIIPEHVESGRSYFSKGMLKQAGAIANKNIKLLANKVSSESPLVGIEPSAILSFRDEYPDICEASLKEPAAKLASNTYTIEEFLAAELDKGSITKDQFTNEEKSIKMHGHCHQKSLSSVVPTKKILSIPENYTVQNIPSGCCGMAGSFGYEKEHYDVSMSVGELVLFPAVRGASADTLISATGTSCRHQIKDGTGREAQHPVEILWEALKK